MSTTTSPMTAPSTLDQILSYVMLAADIAGSLGGPIAAGSKLAEYFLSIAQTAIKAHETLEGKPLDLTQLHDLPPLP